MTTLSERHSRVTILFSLRWSLEKDFVIKEMHGSRDFFRRSGQVVFCSNSFLTLSVLAVALSFFFEKKILYYISSHCAITI